MATSGNASAASEPRISTINSAARRCALIRTGALDGSVDLDALSTVEWEPIIADCELIESWRERHAGPLRNTNANLRHYVRPHSSEGVSVTQRLKKFSTILDKLNRYPTMRLTAMEDIGGVRAVLPNQATADEVARKLRKNWKFIGTATTFASQRTRATARYISS